MQGFLGIESNGGSNSTIHIRVRALFRVRYLGHWCWSPIVRCLLACYRLGGCIFFSFFYLGLFPLWSWPDHAWTFWLASLIPPVTKVFSVIPINLAFHLYLYSLRTQRFCEIHPHTACSNKWTVVLSCSKSGFYLLFLYPRVYNCRKFIIFFIHDSSILCYYVMYFLECSNCTCGFRIAS